MLKDIVDRYASNSIHWICVGERGRVNVCVCVCMSESVGSVQATNLNWNSTHRQCSVRSGINISLFVHHHCLVARLLKVHVAWCGAHVISSWQAFVERGGIKSDCVTKKKREKIQRIIEWECEKQTQPSLDEWLSVDDKSGVTGWNPCRSSQTYMSSQPRCEFWECTRTQWWTRLRWSRQLSTMATWTLVAGSRCRRWC